MPLDGERRSGACVECQGLLRKRKGRERVFAHGGENHPKMPLFVLCLPLALLAIAIAVRLCMPARARSLSVVLIDEDGATGPTPRLSGNTKALLMMFVLFTSITAAQWVGGITAHSLALQADCASMGVDALSYVGNILAECQTDRRPSTLTARPSAWHVRPPRLVALRAEAAPSDPLPQQQGHVPQSRFLPVASSSGQAQAESFAAFHCAAGSACASSSA